MSAVDLLVDKAKEIFQVASEIIENLGDNEKTNLTQLTDDVAKKIGVEPNEICQLIVFFTKHYSRVYVTPGRYGGIFKGIPIESQRNIRAAEKS